MIRTPSEIQALELGHQLERRGFTVLQVEPKRSFFRKRWELLARSAPIQYAPAALHKWVDSTYAFAQENGGSLEQWVPLAPSSEEL